MIMKIPTPSGAWVEQKGKIMHAFTVRGLVIFTVLALFGGGAVGFTFGKIAYQRDDRASLITVGTWGPSPTGYAVPTGSPSPSLPATEDGPGWDCRVEGNHVCKIDKELWLNLSHLPVSLYARCILALESVGLNPEVASIDSEAVCNTLYVNG